MNKATARRAALILAATTAIMGACGSLTAAADPANTPDLGAADAWSRTHDRVWLGGDTWANPMEDWQITDGGAECRSLGGNRSIHSLTHQITHPAKGFTLSVHLSQIEVRGNPEVGKAPHRYVRAHEKGSGFGFITFDTVKRTYTLDSFRFLIDATDGNPFNQFPGWPVTIHQTENRGENRLD